MTWGSVYTGSGNTRTCLSCRHSTVCRSACQKLQPVLCEFTDGYLPVVPGAAGTACRTYTSRNFAAHLSPGELFTSRQLIERTGSTPATASSWCAHMRFLGILEIVERIPSPKGGRPSLLYRYSPKEIPHDR